MRRSSRAACLLVVLTALIGIAPTTDASWCGPTEPVCVDFWKTDAVFVGRVISIEPEPQRPRVAPSEPGMVHVTSEQPFRTRAAVVEVLEPFRGLGALLPGARVDMDIAMPLRGGETLLFFARRQHGRLVVGRCERTRPLYEAAEDLLYARGLATSTETTARVYGQVRWAMQPTADGQPAPPDPLPTATVTVTGEGLERRLTTSTDGRWETRLPPGTYRAVIDVPAIYGGRSDRGAFTIGDPRACLRLDREVDWIGQVTGRVTDASGTPLAGVAVHLTSNRPTVVLSGLLRTHEDGTFQFDDLGRGTHDLRIGVALLPPEETIQLTPRLGPAERLDLGVLRLPAHARTTTVRGVVHDRGGAALPGVRLQVEEVGRHPEFAPAWTDTLGRYVFAAVPGRRYRVTVNGDHASDTVPEPIEAGAAAGPPPIVARAR
jgi:hypothetical protein